MDRTIQPTQLQKWKTSFPWFDVAKRSKSSILSRLDRSFDIEEGVVELIDNTPNSATKSLFATMTNCQEDAAKQALWASNAEFQWYLRLLDTYWSSFSAYTGMLDLGTQDGLGASSFNVHSTQLLTCIAEILSSPGQLPSLEAIRQRLLSEPLLQMIVSEDAAYILIFQIIGWISMIYEPCRQSAGTGEKYLAVHAEDSNGVLLQSDTYRQKAISLKDYTTTRLPLQNVFAQFGHLIPGHFPSGAAPESNLQVDVFREQLVVSYLNFQTLYKVAGIRISWVNCLSLHLEFDEKSKLLKVFRFPSFCKLLCSSYSEQQSSIATNKRSFLCCLFSELLRNQDRASRDNPILVQNRPLDFYREVLLSYRLIFGQDPKSWKAWKTHCFSEVNKFDPAISDPLLVSLCGKDCRNEPVYKDIQAPDVAQQYSAEKHFPFFGGRLVDLQQFVLTKDPSNWKTLWHDRRDILRFYTFWAIVIVGGLSLILAFFQDIEGAIQVAYAIKGSNTNS